MPVAPRTKYNSFGLPNKVERNLSYKVSVFCNSCFFFGKQILVFFWSVIRYMEYCRKNRNHFLTEEHIWISVCVVGTQIVQISFDIFLERFAFLEPLNRKRSSIERKITCFRFTLIPIFRIWEKWFPMRISNIWFIFGRIELQILSRWHAFTFKWFVFWVSAIFELSSRLYITEFISHETSFEFHSFSFLPLEIVIENIISWEKYRLYWGNKKNVYVDSKSDDNVSMSGKCK